MAAGLGTRLMPLTELTSKPTVPIVNHPIMEYIVRLLAAHGVTDLAANLHYHPDEIREHFGDGSAFGVDLRYLFELELSGTAGGVGRFRDFLSDGTFLVMSGDSLTDIDLTAFLAAHRERGGICTMAVKSVDDPSRYGVVVHDDRDRVTGFQEKPDRSEALSNLCNCGIYALESRIFDFIPEGEFVDFAKDVFPALMAADERFHVWRVDSYWNDIGSLDVYRQGNFDALNGIVGVDLAGREMSSGIRLADGADVAADAVLVPPVMLGRGCRVAAGARVVGPVVLGDGCELGEGASVDRSILWSGTTVGSRATVRDAILAGRVLLGDGAVVGPDAVVGDGCHIESGARVCNGARLAAGTDVGAASPSGAD